MTYRTSTHHVVLKGEFDHKVGDWARSTTRKIQRRAEHTAPQRGTWKSQYMSQRHRSWVTKRGPYGFNMIVINDATYAYYVHDGTRPVIEHRWMVFPGYEIWSPRYRVRLAQVKGQAAQPWMREAHRFVMRQEGILAPIFEGGR